MPTIALHIAAQNNNLTEVMQLIEGNIDVHSLNDNGETALHMAACHRNKAVTAALISAGVNVDQQDFGGRTALHRAAQWGRAQNVTALIAAGANKNVRDNHGETALHYGARHSSKMMTMLSYVGLNVTIQNNQGQTARDILNQEHNANSIEVNAAAQPFFNQSFNQETLQVNPVVLQSPVLWATNKNAVLAGIVVAGMVYFIANPVFSLVAGLIVTVLISQACDCLNQTIIANHTGVVGSASGLVTDVVPQNQLNQGIALPAAPGLIIEAPNVTHSLTLQNHHNVPPVVSPTTQYHP